MAKTDANMRARLGQAMKCATIYGYLPDGAFGFDAATLETVVAAARRAREKADDAAEIERAAIIAALDASAPVAGSEVRS